MQRRPTLAVIIPAHDEANVINRCLRFTRDLEVGEVEVVVVANGCSDDTAQRAAQVAGVRVVELPAASKAEALNAGDRAVTSHPRVYLDADITLDAPTLRAMRQTLAGTEPRVCAPRIDFGLDGRPWAVRAFYRIYQQLPYVQDGLVGLGVYGVSSAGRERFSDFPPVTADDLFVQRLFAADERIVLIDSFFRVETPRNLAALVAVRSRSAAGAAELAGLGERHARSTAGTARALARLLVRRPGLLPHALVYVGVGLVAERRARPAHERELPEWPRDSTTR